MKGSQKSRGLGRGWMGCQYVVGRYVDMCAFGFGPGSDILAPLESRAVFMYKRDVGQEGIERCNLAAVCPILAARPTPMAMTTTEDGELRRRRAAAAEREGECVKTLPTASRIRRLRSLRLRCRSALKTSSPPRRTPWSAAGTGATRGAARPRCPRTRSSLSSSEKSINRRIFLCPGRLLKYSSLKKTWLIGIAK